MISIIRNRQPFQTPQRPASPSFACGSPSLLLLPPRCGIGAKSARDNNNNNNNNDNDNNNLDIITDQTPKSGSQLFLKLCCERMREGGTRK